MGFKHPDDGSGEEIEINDPKYIPSAWSEPHPQGTPPDASADPEESKSEYPFNHVYESESGHVREMDDTLGLRGYMNITKQARSMRFYPMVIRSPRLWVTDLK